MNKEYIIKDSRIFDEMINNAPCKKNYYFIVFYRPMKEKNAHYGISSPKKLGKAVVRNKLRRQVRAILHKYQKEYLNNYDCIIIIRKRCLSSSFKTMEEKLINLLNKVKEKESEEKK